ncbi:MAG: HAD family phosphatase [Prevotellaceae bacterium]|jgi:putative hydrolase of the HAD superfamily|nr:HAD family phosphatase [Prevotellaceae bacterium]
MKKNIFFDAFDNDIRNIIFDLGGVIINVDYHKTENAFKNLGISEFDKIFSQVRQSKIVDRLEVGDITPEKFRESLRQMCGTSLTDEIIDNAWNAMILNFPDNRIATLEKLRQKYKIFLLSNTNKIHIDYCMSNINFEKIKSKFDKVYLSHEIHLRKPNTEIYEFVLHDARLQASQTLFIDDTLKNVEGAQLAGLNAYHLTTGETIEDIFTENGL